MFLKTISSTVFDVSKSYQIISLRGENFLIAGINHFMINNAG